MWLALILVLILSILFYKFVTSRSKSFFKKYGIRQIDTSAAVSKLDIFLGRKGLPLADDFAYQTMGGEKYCGVSEMGNNMIIIKDLELLKKILIKDFDHFVDRRDFLDSERTFKRMLPSLKGDEWKGVRAEVIPIFKTGKIRKMMEIFNKVGKMWVADFKEKAASSRDGSAIIEALPTVNAYTIDVIASAIFGIQSETIKNPNSTFAKMATKMSEPSKWQLIKIVFFLQFPKFASKVLQMQIIDEDVRNYFEGILEQGLKARMSGSIENRNDVLQLLVEAKKNEIKNAGEKKQWLTEQVMISTAFALFIAGFSTTSSTIIFAVYALAIDQDMQDELRNEVDKIVRTDGTLDYDELSTLVYLEMVLCEVLRKYPPAARLERRCVKDYKDSESGLFVQEGVTIAIPMYSIHHDPKYYENPEKFDPEHFNPKNKAKRSSYAYMPFGIGPRNCIGLRLGLVQTKVAIAQLVHFFRIEPTKKTPIPIEHTWIGYGMIPPKGLELKLTPIKNKTNTSF
ncbi:Cytochrome P450 9e2 [Orchesella cincta]|uniref:Cytochrome P450 9e2 n=1 Tax=Orchesella cincta TaxID=48709 RepID=A0A1D2MEX6_ORCCI|nr:Cytochrome P450 9e2 [Orchesella cincta]